jgi:4-hydroxybenzoyl-CoA thioesterase
VIETTITEIKRSSFSVTHRILKDGELAVEGFETRVWVARDPADPDKIKAKALPQEIVAKLRAG